MGLLTGLYVLSFGRCDRGLLGAHVLECGSAPNTVPRLVTSVFRAGPISYCVKGATEACQSCVAITSTSRTLMPKLFAHGGGELVIDIFLRLLFSISNR